MSTAIQKIELGNQTEILSLPKIQSIDRLIEIIKRHKFAGKRIVLCHGVFDLLHIGHIRYLTQAKSYGDILVATLTPDHYVDKGPGRPAFHENLRAEAVASLGCVDYVAINQWDTAEETIRLLKPDVYAKGSDFNGSASDMTGKLAREEKIIKELGGQMIFTEDIVFSSTNLINRFFSSFPLEIQQYLTLFRKRYTLDEVLRLIDKMASLNVLIVGDTILDEYHFCHAIGTSSKDPVLAVQYDSHDLFPGGVLAVANHVAGLANNVRMASVVGKIESHETFIQNNMSDNISPFFMEQENAPTIVKRRYVDGYSFNKMFEVYVMDDSGLPEEKDKVFCQHLKEELNQYDLVIAADFGHGTISDRLRNILAREAPYLAVNTQANSGNRGLHTITRYSRADFISLAEHELRLEIRKKTGNMRPGLKRISEQLGSKISVVTSGKQGCLVRHCDGTMVEVPAFAQKVVDRIGAGDAFFAVAALAAYLEAPAELVGFIGNVVGALAVEILGNQHPIDEMSIRKYITSLMK